MASQTVADCYYKFTIPTSVRGHHVYKNIREATIGQDLSCQREMNNRHDPFAVAVLGYWTVVRVFVRGRNSTGK